MTPLHHAIAYSKAAIAKLILKSGADPHVTCDVSTYYTDVHESIGTSLNYHLHIHNIYIRMAALLLPMHK